MRLSALFISILISTLIISCAPGNLIYKIPDIKNDGIKTGFAAETGLDSIKLIKMTEDISNNIFINIHSVLISRYNKLIYEEYFNGYKMEDKHELRSAAKSLGSALVGISIDKGFLKGTDQKLLNFFGYYPVINNYDKRKDKISIKHILTMTSGFECGKIMDNMNSCGAQMYNHLDPIKYILDLPMKNEPGEVFDYNDGTPTVLMAMVGISSNMQAGKFQDQYLYGPLGIKPDPQNLGITSRDMLKFGLLYMNKGKWNGQQIISKEWVEESTKISYKFDNPYNDGYGYFWWVRTFEVNGKKYQTYYAAGNGGQYIFIFPESELVIVFTGGNYNDYGFTNKREIVLQPYKIVNNYILPALIN